MSDDPHDATWIPAEKKIIWCPVHNMDMENCGCGRQWPIGMTGAVLLILAMLGCLSLAIGAFVGL